jgi:nucleotide-binding universal stress UspA family protein
MKILVAYDGSPAAQAAVDEVVGRPWPPNSEVRLVTVVEPHLAATPAMEVYGALYEKVRAALREEAYKKIQKALEKFKSRPDLETGYELREGGVKQSLLTAIKEWGADLVVAGHATNGIARFFLGSVCHALVTSAPCNVEVVKTHHP